MNAADSLSAAIAAAPWDALPGLMRQIWAALAEGLIGDSEAARLDAAARERQAGARMGAAGRASSQWARMASRLKTRVKRGKDDRAASRARRRVLGGSSALPDTMRGAYSEAKRSVLCVVAGEVKRRGVCDLCLDKIAAIAGVCRTTARDALHEARRLGHVAIAERPRRGARSLTNVVRIVSKAWLQWIARAPNAAQNLVAAIGCNFSSASAQNRGSHVEHRKNKGAFEGRAGPPGHAEGAGCVA